MNTIVAGSGIGGLLISDRLSKAGRPHILVGGPRPDPDVPRLGESISLHGTIGLREVYPDASRFFTSKKSLRIVLREQEIVFDFDFSTSFTRGLGFWLANTAPPADLIHVDRSRFDPYLYDKVVCQPHVSVRHALIKAIESDGDRVRAVRLDDGTRLDTTYLFDATNGGRILAGPMKVARQDFGSPHRVVFTHFRRPEAEDAGVLDRLDWAESTVIMRLFRDVDGLDGVLWSIPLPGKMSVGASLIGEAELDDAAILNCALDRLRADGMNIEALFPDRGPLISFDNRYYMHERASGANWMLVGPACAAVWWPSATGVGVALAAAENAVLALDHPGKAGARYQRYINTLMTTHRSLDGLLLPGAGRLEEAQIKRESIRRNYSEAERWLSSPTPQRNPLIRYTSGFRPYVVPLLLRAIKLSEVTERHRP